MSVKNVMHLNLPGNAREALEFYNSVFGGQLIAATYADFGAPADAPGSDKIVFGQVVAENGFHIMAYDIPQAGQAAPAVTSTRRENYVTITDAPAFISLSGDTVEEVTALWEKLSEGATIVEALAPAQWAPLFGMLTDKFGYTWSFGVEAAHNG